MNFALNYGDLRCRLEDVDYGGCVLKHLKNLFQVHDGSLNCGTGPMSNRGKAELLMSYQAMKQM